MQLVTLLLPPLECTYAAPPHVIESEEVSLMHELGPEVRLECGIRLGALSRRKAYEVNWQRVLGKDSIIIISSCMSPDHNEDDTAGVQDDCKAEFDFEDFSLTRSNVEPDDSGRAVFKCIVNLQFQPSSNPHAGTFRDVDTIVMFYGKVNLWTWANQVPQQTNMQVFWGEFKYMGIL